MQVSTMSVQLGLGSKLVGWYRYSMSLPYGQYLINLSRRTHKILRYSTENGSDSTKSFDCFLWWEQLGSKEGLFWRPKRLANQRSQDSSRHQSAVLIRNRFCLYLILCTTRRIWLLNQLQSMNFQSIKVKNPTYQINSLKMENDENLFATADSLVSLVDKTLSCLHIKISILQTLLLDSVEAGVLLSEFAQLLRRKMYQDLIYYIWRCCNVFNSGFESECQNQRQQKLAPSQNQNCKICKRCSRKVLLLMDLWAISQTRTPCKRQRRDSFFSKTLYTEFTLATQQIEGMKVFCGVQKRKLLFWSGFCW